MIIFRVDANSMIGKVHMKRCVSIAKALKMAGRDVLFVTREDSDKELLDASFMEYRTISSMQLGSEKAINQLKEIITETNAGVCVVDSCDISNNAFKTLREICKVVLIEDTYYGTMDVDCVINYNLYADKIDYMSKYPANVELLLGTDYAPYLSEEISAFVNTKDKEISTILLYTGELDSHELAPGIIDSILDAVDDNVRIRAITSQNAFTKDILYKMSNSISQLIIEQDVSNISKLVKFCDVAVTVASPICYDLLGYNIPSCVYMSDYSQNMLMSSLTDAGVMSFGGDFVKKSNRFYGELVEGVTRLIDKDYRTSIRDKVSALNLGKGAKNIANAIMKYE